MFATQRKPKWRSSLFWLIPVSAALLMAAEPSWRNKAIPDWTDEDARQLLSHSPWAKTVIANINRLQTEDQRREGGNMGQEHGVGFDGVDPKQTKHGLPASLFSGPEGLPQATRVTLQLRWESALPIRAAELKSRVVEPPTLAGEGYSIAVYGVPGTYFKGDPKSLGEPLKKQAFLRRQGQKDVKPISVEVFQRGDGLVVVYLFPLSAEIQKKDGRVEFDALIGRIGVAESFDVAEMEFQGKLALLTDPR